MTTKKQEMQRIIHLYREETGEKEIDMHDVALFAMKKGWPMPKPETPLERLAKQFSEAAREEVRRDAITGRPYRANLAISGGSQQGAFWVDIDEAPRKHAHKSFVQRREQMVGDGLQLSFDVDHWNSINPTEEPIVMPMDLTLDIEWRKNAPDDDAIEVA
ncbi:hypothetical protein [Oxalicibacterium faecigallinarum]|uniref:Uncharacterized protein n=1 Tax=Oxalicibacterium faecigallinarum TaxID=573741 RepID=A0A8J3AX12_9BURK|nr:hypothetical protein [Oxalicibacterium faecigallinarum]GGI18176.1 hypothetical protein GCM10008066_12690 [Oxalicibacterium faecigallinarum]